MPNHRARGGRVGPVVAVLIVATMGVLTARQLGDAESGAAIDSDGAVAGEQEAAVYPGVHAAVQRVRPGETLRPLPEPVCRPKPVDETITVVSFNIKSALSGLDRITAALRAADADIVLLQEVDKHRATSRYVDQPAYLADQLGMESAFGANVLRGSNRYGRSEYGTAILSRFPIKSQENTLLPNGPGGQQRGLLHAVVDVNGLALSVYGTHLQNIYDSMKMRQIQAIAPILAADERPMFFGGDMNAHPTSSVLRVAYGVLDDPYAAGVGIGSQLTHPATRPRGRIDYVLHRGEGLQPLSVSVLAPGVSDHRPVRATYQLTGFGGEVCRRPKLPDLSDVDAALRDAEDAVLP